MDNILKQRLIGALILVALGVVFWPIIFVEPEGPGGLPGSRMPPPPEVNTTPIEPPDTAGLRQAPEVAAQQEARAEETAAVEAEPEPEATAEEEAPLEAVASEPDAGVESATVEPERSTRTSAPESPQLDAQGVPVAWILQVVSLSNKSRAETIRDDLIGDGHKAYVKAIRSGDRTLYRVYIGPKFERAQLDKIKADIDRQLGVKSMVARYVP